LSTVIRNDEAGAIAEDAGVRYVEDRCRKVEDARLLGRSRRDGDDGSATTVGCSWWSS
jgi:hypothetical protein